MYKFSPKHHVLELLAATMSLSKLHIWDPVYLGTDPISGLRPEIGKKNNIGLDGGNSALVIGF